MSRPRPRSVWSPSSLKAELLEQLILRRRRRNEKLLLEKVKMKVAEPSSVKEVHHYHAPPPAEEKPTRSLKQSRQPSQSRNQFLFKVVLQELDPFSLEAKYHHHCYLSMMMNSHLKKPYHRKVFLGTFSSRSP
jgi:hypothetical protein